MRSVPQGRRVAKALPILVVSAFLKINLTELLTDIRIRYDRSAGVFLPAGEIFGEIGGGGIGYDAGRKLNPFDNQGSYRISEELSGPDQDQLAGPLMWSLRENCVGREGGRRGGKRTQLMPETALTLSAPNQVFAPPPRAQGCFEQV